MSLRWSFKKINTVTLPAIELSRGGGHRIQRFPMPSDLPQNTNNRKHSLPDSLMKTMYKDQLWRMIAKVGEAAAHLAN